MKLGRTVHYPERPAPRMRKLAVGWKNQHPAESKRGTERTNMVSRNG